LRAHGHIKLASGLQDIIFNETTRDSNLRMQMAGK
jgi:hypothetical protein